MWIETTPEVYKAIYVTHKDQLELYSSYTNLDENYGKFPVKITERSFKDYDYPILKLIEEKENDKWENTYFIYSVKIAVTDEN